MEMDVDAQDAAGDEQDVAEALDPDELGAAEDYQGEQPLDFPPDRPVEREATEIDDLRQDSVTERHQREIPDPLVEELDHPGRRPIDDDGPSDTALVATTDVLDDDEAELLAEGVAPVGDESAEEQALHIEPER